MPYRERLQWVAGDPVAIYGTIFEGYYLYYKIKQLQLRKWSLIHIFLVKLTGSLSSYAFRANKLIQQKSIA